MHVWGDTAPVGGKVTTPENFFFNIDIFRKNTSEYAKLMVEPCICDNLNHNYNFFFIFNKKILKLENRLEGIRLISFVPVWLSFAGIKIVCYFLKFNCYNLYRLYVSPKEGDWHNIYFLIIYPFIYFYFNNSSII